MKGILPALLNLPFAFEFVAPVFRGFCVPMLLRGDRQPLPFCFVFSPSRATKSFGVTPQFC
jgi:hypothetical protein